MVWRKGGGGRLEGALDLETSPTAPPPFDAAEKIHNETKLLSMIAEIVPSFLPMYTPRDGKFGIDIRICGLGPTAVPPILYRYAGIYVG